MSFDFLNIDHCPATLREGEVTYGKTGLRHMFEGRKVSHCLPYSSPSSDEATDLFYKNKTAISISGVQEKFSVILEKNNLRLAEAGEHGSYLLKPIPKFGKNADQMPANEHLTMQIASQVFYINTAENALIFFDNGEPAYLTKRFDLSDDGVKKGQEDFASLMNRLPHTHGDHYKYLGSYLDLFKVLKRHVPAYAVEAPKLFKLIVFNYLFGNGDAHVKNFSLSETALGDFILSPAYDLLNTRLHINDSDFALSDGLLPKALSKGKVKDRFLLLGEKAGISPKKLDRTLGDMLKGRDQVLKLIDASFLSDKMKRAYKQTYETRLKKMLRP